MFGSDRWRQIVCGLALVACLVTGCDSPESSPINKPLPAPVATATRTTRPTETPLPYPTHTPQNPRATAEARLAMAQNSELPPFREIFLSMEYLDKEGGIGEVIKFREGLMRGRVSSWDGWVAARGHSQRYGYYAGLFLFGPYNDPSPRGDARDIVPWDSIYLKYAAQPDVWLVGLSNEQFSSISIGDKVRFSGKITRVEIGFRQHHLFATVSDWEVWPKERKLPTYDISSVRITLERTICYSKCPVYSLEINGQGEVTYNGRENVAVLGRRTAKITKDQVRLLVAEFESIGFCTLPDEYYRHNHDPDTLITIATPKCSKTVIRGRTIEQEARPVIVLENKIEEIVNSKQWVRK
jgi:hypothetical protein